MKHTTINNCWYGIFLDAYTYSTTYLLFSLTVTIASILMLWIYEKPRFYKLIFKRSKHSNIIISPGPSDEVRLQNHDESIPDCDTTNFLKTTDTSNAILEPGEKADLLF